MGVLELEIGVSIILGVTFRVRFSLWIRVSIIVRVRMRVNSYSYV